MNTLQFLVLFCISLHAARATAGPLEALSEQAFKVTGNKCEPLAQSQSDEICDPKESSLQENAKDVKQIAQLAGQSEEDRYFYLLAQQQVRELQCASDYAKNLVAQNSKDFANSDLKKKLTLAREVRAKTAELAKKIVSDPGLATPVCPTSFETLEEQVKGFKKNARYNACKELISLQNSYKVIMSAIPLSGAPEVKSVIEKFSSSTQEISDQDMIKNLNSAYQETQKALDENRSNLTASIVGQGGQGLDRTTRHDLLADPALSASVVKSQPKLSEVACLANARYGQGADNLNNGVMIGSLFLGAGASVVGKVGAFTAKAFSTAQSARTVGMVSYNAMNMMKYAVMATDFASMAAVTDQACFKTKVADLKTSGACISAPTADRQEQDNCIMAASLTALGVVPQKALSAFKGKVKKAIAEENASQAGRIADADQFLDTKASIKRNNATSTTASSELRPGATGSSVALEKKLAEGNIVSDKRVGQGVYGARFVRYEDGSEGVWKPRAVMDEIDTSKSEVAAYNIDKYLGLNNTPVTVIKEYKGEIGSVQYRVKNLKDQSPYETFADDPDQLGFFDYLVANGDRHGFNYLQKEDGKLVAIDHGLSFGGGRGKDPFVTFQGNVGQLDKNLRAQEKMTKSIESGGRNVASMKEQLAELKRKESELQSAIKAFTPQKEVVEKLKATSFQDWKKVTAGNLTEYQIQDMQKRQETLLRAIEMAEKKIGADRLYPSGEASPLIKKVHNRYYSE
ncbi:phosphatidylinositol 4-kinase [Bdellovibrio sp. SKB1291214]|uniref:hypothetical protein n=1 Tax=Bdellovibrio sp. SKB1291214 TaxID=1732569 RepID=UPI000B51D545|nr:hypothetical protein [Bdellovibrio sp. SKB1291214]UYL08417.1 phosphatidylinositol 4-kinase [Bdellovibrio sp. SKB1291214]